jgi:chlorite dismutase
MHDPRVPETLEGWSQLHQMFRVRWSEWQALAAGERQTLAAEAADTLAGMGRGEQAASACVTLLGHKGDLMLVHFRRGFEALQQAQLRVARLGIARFLEPTTSYVSVVELGMYEMTAQIHGRLHEKGLKPGSDEYEAGFDPRWRSRGRACRAGSGWRYRRAGTSASTR